MEFQEHFKHHVFSHYVPALNQLFMDLLDGMWNRNMRPHITVDTRKIVVEKGARPSAFSTNSNHVILNLSMDAVGSLSPAIIDGSVGMRLTMRFNQVATTFWFPLTALINIYDLDGASRSVLMYRDDYMTFVQWSCLLTKPNIAYGVLCVDLRTGKVVHPTEESVELQSFRDSLVERMQEFPEEVYYGTPASDMTEALATGIASGKVVDMASWRQRRKA